MTSADFCAFSTALGSGYTFRRIPRRPPRVPHVSFPPSTCRLYHKRFRVVIGLRLVCSLTPAYSLINGFCSSGQRFARWLVCPQHPASFRFHLTMDTLAFGYILPTTGRIPDFHRLETCAAGRTKNWAWTSMLGFQMTIYNTVPTAADRNMIAIGPTWNLRISS